MNPFSMFWEKETPSGNYHWSMTRVVSFLFALTTCYAIVTMAQNNHAHDIGWPFCFLGVATLLAVPLQILFKKLQTWMMTAPGKKLTGDLLALASSKITTVVEAKASTTGSADQ